jgi:hypothetical protein
MLYYCDCMVYVTFEIDLYLFFSYYIVIGIF